MSTTDEPHESLFDIERARRLMPGDLVAVQTMWGDETCNVVEVGSHKGWPVVTVRGSNGDTYTLSISRVRAL